MNKRILITGSQGFIGGYMVAEFLEQGWHVVGLDNYSKYGEIAKDHDRHPNYDLRRGDAKDVELLKELLMDCDHFLAGAAMIGGIRYFHQFAYDLLAENERIIAAACDAAIHAHQHGQLKKITVVSSSLVYDGTTVYPTPEGVEREIPPPRSTYGFQKLACEYFATAVYEQHGVPYTIVRPFNGVGIGEQRALGIDQVRSGNIKMAMSHVVPDLIQKVLRGQDPLHILGDGQQVRHYTYGADLARGIRMAIEHPAATNEDFNISVATSTTVLELAEMIWKKINPDKPFRYVCDEPLKYDVRRRIPDVSKAKRLLGFEATTPLDHVLDEVIPWVEQQMAAGLV